MMKFPQKLWDIINSCETEAIRWNNEGSTILIDYSTFQDQYLSPGTLFKTRNINSFVRQLNLYGFRKVTSAIRDPSWNLHNPDIHEFYHKNFCANKYYLLRSVVRKAKYSKKLKHFNIDHHKSADKENIFSDTSCNLNSKNYNSKSIMASLNKNQSEEFFNADTSEVSNQRLAIARNALRKALEDATAKCKSQTHPNVEEEFCEDNGTALPVFVTREESSELIVPDMAGDMCINWEERSSFPLFLSTDDPAFQISTTDATFDKLDTATGWTADDASLPADFPYGDMSQHAELLLPSREQQSMYDRLQFPQNTDSSDQQIGLHDSNTIVQNFMDLINDLPPSTLANKPEDYEEKHMVD